MTARHVLRATLTALVAWYLLVIFWGPQWAMCHDSLNFIQEALRLPHEGRIGSYVHGPLVYELIAAFEAGYYVVLRLIGTVHSPADHLVHVLTNMPSHIRGVETLMAIGGCATLVQIYRVGRIFGGPAAGAAAAVLCATNATFLIMTSFAKEDVFFWFFLFFAMEQAWTASESGRRAPAVRAGIAIGCALAVKYFAVFALLLVVLPLVRAGRGTRAQAFRLGITMAISAGVALVIVFPFLFTDTAVVVKNIRDTNAGYAVMSQQLTMGAYLRSHLPNVAGWIVMIAGTVELARRLVADRHGPVILAAVPVSLFLFLGLRPGFSLAYYAVPMALMLFVLAASLVAYLAARVGPPRQALVWAAAALVLITDPFLPGAVKYSLLLTGPETRLLARDAIVSKARPGDCVLLNLAVAGENFFGPPLGATNMPAGSGPFTNARAVANQRMAGPKFEIRLVEGETSPTRQAANGCEWLVLGRRGTPSPIEVGGSFAFDKSVVPSGNVAAPPGYEPVARINAFPDEHSRNFPLYTSLDYDALRADSIVRFLRDRSMGPSFDIYRRTADVEPAQ